MSEISHGNESMKNNLYSYEYNLLEKNQNIIDENNKHARRAQLDMFLKQRDWNSWRNHEESSTTRTRPIITPTAGQLLADMYAVESGLMECSILASDCMARATLARAATFRSAESSPLKHMYESPMVLTLTTPCCSQSESKCWKI